MECVFNQWSLSQEVGRELEKEMKRKKKKEECVRPMIMAPHLLQGGAEVRWLPILEDGSVPAKETG